MKTFIGGIGCFWDETKYENINFCSSVIQKNVFATQFHLEKSGENGLEVLKNFFNYFR